MADYTPASELPNDGSPVARVFYEEMEDALNEVIAERDVLEAANGDLTERVRALGLEVVALREQVAAAPQEGAGSELLKALQDEITRLQAVVATQRRIITGS